MELRTVFFCMRRVVGAIEAFGVWIRLVLIIIWQG